MNPYWIFVIPAGAVLGWIAVQRRWHRAFKPDEEEEEEAS